jgi:hypothetical protein
MTDRKPADLVVETLSAYLGPHTARTAVKTFAERNLGLAPEALTRADAKKLVDALRPTLSGLLGSAKTSEVLQQLLSILES